MIRPASPAGFSDDEAALPVWGLRMRAEGLTENTIAGRERLVRWSARQLGKPMVTATRLDLLRLLSTSGWAPSSKQGNRSSFRVFYGVLQDEGIRDDNPADRLPRIKTPRFEPNPVSTSDIQRLLTSGIYARTRMMVLLGAYQGFRVGEIAAVHGRNIDWVNQRILTAEAKGGVELWRPLQPIVWTEAQSFPRDGFWFPNWRDNRRSGVGEGHILAGSVSTLISTAMRRAGIVGHKPHNLRAWFATELIEAGADTMTAQFAMRHANQATLQRYVKPSSFRIGAAMAQLPEVQVPAHSGRVRRP
jgi:integrase